MKTYQNFIGGIWKNSISEKRVENLNPARSDEVLGSVPLSSRAEAQEAVEAAADAFPAWRKTPAPLRGKLVQRVVQLMEERKEELAQALTREEGKTIRDARGEIQRSINIMDFIGSEGRRMGGYTAPSELPDNFAYTIRHPLGVVALITPWNFPAAIPCWKIAPALVAGNTVVFKPATLTPETATKVIEVFEEAGLPPGVLNMVIGSGSTVGEELVSNSHVKAISFTGSNEIGVRVYEQGALHAARVQCEMGGKNPVVILEDADLSLAMTGTVDGAFGSTGQRCTATSRVVVQERVADQFVELLLNRLERYKIGIGLDEEVDMGPSVEKKQMEKVLEYIDIGKEEGAHLLWGGFRMTDGDLAKGYFVAPTVFDRVRPESRIAQEEIFGPVLSIIRVNTFEEAMAVANSVQYGLTSSIYSNDFAKIFRFIEEIETGITHVNSPTLGGEAQLPFGGTKATGIGPREQGRDAIDFYSEVKTVYIDYTGKRREGKLY